MTCEILSAERLQRVLSRQVGAEELAMLRAHLETDCQPCLERLEGVSADELLGAFSGAPLAVPEADAMFLRAHVRRLPWRVPLALAASVLLVVVFFRGADLRDKGAGDIPAIELSAFAGKKIDGRPTIDRALGGEDRLKGGEEVLFRYRLESAAFVYLLIESDRGVELAYASEEASPSGERELAARGQALALDPAGMGRKIEVVAAASVDPVPKDKWSTLSNVRALSEVCSRCGTARITLLVEDGP